MYEKAFSAYYNQKLNYFSKSVSDILHQYLEPKGGKTLLDLCCGTGWLAHYFLERGFYVKGIDLSENMLSYAKDLNDQYIKMNKAEFLCDDATSFELNTDFAYVVSTYDALNHLPNMEQLSACFRRVLKHTKKDGIFIFDLNTLKGLSRSEGTTIQEYNGEIHVTKSQFNAIEKTGSARYYGFLKTNKDDVFIRYDETITNTIFNLKDVKECLFNVGWEKVKFYSVTNLYNELKYPENEDRVFIVATK